MSSRSANREVSKKVAYLGPAGTYSQLALREFVPNAEQVAKRSIAETFESLLNAEVDAAIVPLENIKEGPVAETLDLLCQYREEVVVTNAFLMEIEHALGIISDASSTFDMSKIKHVFSRGEALRQCSTFIQKQCPDAELVPTISTAQAIERLGESKPGLAAAIAPKVSLEQRNLRIAAEGISDVSHNRTRFVLVERGATENHFNTSEPGSFVTPISIFPQRDRKALLYDLISVISDKHQINMLAIHSRPNTAGGFWFYLELEGHPLSEKMQQCLKSLEQFCSSATDNDTTVSVLGGYPLVPFTEAAVKTVGVIGANGMMGRWFQDFLSSCAIEVIAYDLNSDFQLTALCEKCDTLVLSVPMNSVSSVLEELLPALRPGHLLVENCSVKSCILPKLKELLPLEVELLSIHTMFGGGIELLEGERVIVCETAQAGAKAQAFEDLLFKHGARITYSSAEEHDVAMAAVQSVEQLTAIAVADLLSSIPELDKFHTRNSRIYQSLIERVLNQNDSLITDLQLMNPHAHKLRHQLLERLFRMIADCDLNSATEILTQTNRARALLLAKEPENHE